MSYLLSVISAHHTSFWNNCIIHCWLTSHDLFSGLDIAGPCKRILGPIEHVPANNAIERCVAIYSSSWPHR
jgi:hypothetical protein